MKNKHTEAVTASSINKMIKELCGLRDEVLYHCSELQLLREEIDETVDEIFDMADRRIEYLEFAMDNDRIKVKTRNKLFSEYKKACKARNAFEIAVEKDEDKMINELQNI